MLNYAVFTHSDFSAQITGVDWCAVDVLLRRGEINPSPQAFEDFRVILNGFIEAENTARNQSKPNSKEARMT